MQLVSLLLHNMNCDSISKYRIWLLLLHALNYDSIRKSRDVFCDGNNSVIKEPK
jgi:hypothetical protein